LHIVFILLQSNHQSNQPVDKHPAFNLFLYLFSFFHFINAFAYLA
jgi:hypothetical protein